MILKRRKNRNYSVIDNAVFDDERLSFQAMALLAWLRSRPNNWTLQVDHLRKRFGIGRDKVYKLVQELIETGWIVREWARAGGVFEGVEYVVLDEPRDRDPELPFPEIQETAESQAVEQPSEAATTEPDQPVLTVSLNPGPFPDLPDPGNQETLISKERSTKPPLPPSDEGGSLNFDLKKEPDLPAVIEAGAPEERELRERTRRRLRRREPGEPTFETPTTSVFIAKGSPEWQLWNEHYGLRGGRELSSVWNAEHQCPGRYERTRWPPGYADAEHRSLAAHSKSDPAGHATFKPDLDHVAAGDESGERGRAGAQAEVHR